MQCPRLFYYKSILKISTPPTLATAKGTAAHYAFEHVFNHPAGERTPEAAVSYVAPAWEVMTNPLGNRDEVEEGTPEHALREAEGKWEDTLKSDEVALGRAMRDADNYLALAPRGSDEERVLLEDTVSVVTSWFAMENPNKFEPAEREKYVHAKVGGVSVHGFIDRYDVIASSGGERRYVSDYKTGKKVSPRYADDAFFQLETYAVLLKEMTGSAPHQLRLLYVKAGSPDGVLTRDVTPMVLKKTESKIVAVAKGIEAAHRAQEWAPRPQVLCDWCYFKSVCPAFAPELEGLLPEEIKKVTGEAGSKPGRH